MRKVLLEDFDRTGFNSRTGYHKFFVAVDDGGYFSISSSG